MVSHQYESELTAIAGPCARSGAGWVEMRFVWRVPLPSAMLKPRVMSVDCASSCYLVHASVWRLPHKRCLSPVSVCCTLGHFCCPVRSRRLCAGTARSTVFIFHLIVHHMIWQSARGGVCTPFQVVESPRPCHVPLFRPLSGTLKRRSMLTKRKL